METGRRTLTPTLERFIHKQVSEGFPDPSRVLFTPDSKMELLPSRYSFYIGDFHSTRQTVLTRFKELQIPHSAPDTGNTCIPHATVVEDLAATMDTI